MGHGDSLEPMFLTQRGEPRVTKIPGGHLDAHPIGRRIFLRVKIHFQERHSHLSGPVPDEGLIGITLVSPEMEVTVSQGDIMLMPGLQEEPGHNHGVDPAAHRQQDRPSIIGKQSVKTIVKTVPHTHGNYFLFVNE